MFRDRASRLLRAVVGCALVAYPLIVWAGLSSQRPRLTALVLFGILAPAVLLMVRRSAPTRVASPGLVAVPLIPVLAFGVSALLDATGLMLLVPVAINLVLLLSFAASLHPRSTPMIERFARLQSPELTAPQQEWCRMWTGIWCGLFVVNGGVALVLAAAAPLSWWVTYNGLLAYLLIGLLLGTEVVLRRRRFGAQGVPATHGPPPMGKDGGG